MYLTWPLHTVLFQFFTNRICMIWCIWLFVNPSERYHHPQNKCLHSTCIISRIASSNEVLGLGPTHAKYIVPLGGLGGKHGLVTDVH